MTSAALPVPDTRPARAAAEPLARQQAGLAWAFVLPFLIGLMIFLVVPCAAVVVLALTDWQLGSAAIKFTGLGNFVQLAADAVFQRSFANTLFYAATVTPVSVVLGLWLAVTVERSTIGRAFFRSVFFLPVVSTTVAMAVVWEFLLHPSLGPLNAMMSMIGIPRHVFLNDARTVLPTLAAIGIWENAGYNMVLFIAGLKSIPSDLYDAAAVDGADRSWERFWTVTLPLLGPTLLFVIIISFLRSFRVFETVAAITQGGPQFASEVVLYTIYREGFVYFHVGYASALTVIFVALLLLLTLVKFYAIDRSVHYQ